jgi:PAS domain S-box-containing protein
VIPAAHAGMVATWQADRERLVAQAPQVILIIIVFWSIPYQSGQALPGQAFEQEALRLDEVDFARDYNLPPEYLLIYRDATEGRLPISSLVVPIQTGDNKLGVLVLDNFKASAAFTAEDQALIASLARQTALTLENVRLYQASEQRAVQLLALTQVAGTITSSLQTTDLINSLLDQAKNILPYDTGTLWLRQGDKLTVRAARGFEDSDQRIGLSVAVADSLLLKEMVDTSQPLYVGDVREDPRFPSLIEHQYLSWLGVPLISQSEVVGVIALEKSEANFYNAEHIASAVTFAGQAAVGLVNANLYEDIARRAAELDERTQRLSLLNRLSAELSGSLDVEYILGVAINELSQAVKCTVVSGVLFDEENRASVHAETPQVVASYPVKLPESPVYDRIHESLGVFSVEDVTEESLLTSLRSFFKKRSTRALLILPLATGNNLHGLVLIQADQPYRYDADEVEMARTIGNQAAVAIQNARLFAETERLFAETQQRSAELSTLFDLWNITQVLDQQKLIDTTFENTIRLLKADSVGLVMTGDAETLVIRALDQGEKVGPMTTPRSSSSFSEYVLQTGEPLIIRNMDVEREKLPVKGYTIGSPVKSWLGVPLTVRGTTSGVLSVQSYRPFVFGEAQMGLISQVANQLAVALDNARLFETVQNYAADLAKRVSERTQELEIEHNRTQTLLNIITELSASLDLDLVLNRTLAVLNEAISAEHSLIMLMRPDEEALYLRASLGYTTPPPKGGKTSSIKPNQGLAGWVLTNRQATLVPDLLDDERWVQRDDQPSQHRSALAVPLMMGEESLGVLLLYHRQPNRFDGGQLDLVTATAKQIAVAINNAQLYNLIRNQAEQLGDMLRTQHIETSRSQAILEAVADGVLVTDANREITLFNVSGERILGLDRFDLLGRSLEHFIGLFGKAAQTWVETIRTWSEDPLSYKPGETYAEQIELDDRRVVSVHLSPVLLRSDFLGTVSIFRDITHMIEVDRLKSEFVATVSHELRTPMTSIKGYVEIMLMGAAGPISEQQAHFLQVVKSNTERLAILVNDLLDISRIEAGRVALSFQPLDLYKISDRAIETIKQRMQDEKRPMTVETDLPPDLPVAFGDQERVQQILDNLVENAYQYTPEGGKIIIRIHQVDNDVQFDVQDNGIGILPEDQPRVFERFFRGEDPLVLATSGTGLGLSIVKHLVEMHHGRIWFESPGVPGLGTVFSFTMPIYTTEAAAETSENKDESEDLIA